MDELTRKIEADFDRIALLDEDGWNHNDQYHDYLLQNLPSRMTLACEVGCGKGKFARLLAQRAERVLALDLSAEMIRMAKAQSAGFPHIDYQIADVAVIPLPEQHFDCIVSIATLHHLSLEAILPRLKAALRPGGVLAILDLFQSQWPDDLLNDLLAVPANVVVKAIRNRRLSANSAAQAAWDEHGRTDVYLTMAQVREIAGRLLPGAIVRRHLFWRYSLVWTKQG